MSDDSLQGPEQDYKSPLQQMHNSHQLNYYPCLFKHTKTLITSFLYCKKKKHLLLFFIESALPGCVLAVLPNIKMFHKNEKEVHCL